MTTPPTRHLEAMLQHDIDLIRSRLLEMAALDEEALTHAFQAFLQRDRQMAYSVILRDQDVDALETELDRLCLQFFVRHQPAAGHLRFVFSSSKIVNELERIGDYAESIARQVLLIAGLPFEVPTDRFTEMANLAIPMLHDAVRAFVERNADLARATMGTERQVDQIRDSLSDELVEWRQQGILPLEALSPLIMVARRFERVSDQALNICEEALYVATGEYMRHKALEGFRVLFVDETNGCLSRLAEAAGNGLGARRFSFCSAGMLAGTIDPHTAAFLAEKGVDVSRTPSRSVEEVPGLDEVHVVVALCREAERALPRRPAKNVGLDWFMADPSNADGSPDEISAAYEQTYESLTHHVRDLVQAILGNDYRQHEQTNHPI
ncbi:MAG: phosphate signaling complex protein PhoU [Acidobacteria bacterium]|nr:phosphate signaling complex protein PhoU [Acidobacteriota bacterium]